MNLLEKDITSSWGDFTNPKVSICCNTYNHGKFISVALDSFLMQKTSFPFEIVVCDDCSTDNTTEIIKEYKAKYPNIINAILLPENHYSKGVKVDLIAMGQTRGDYVAICEGDDYWTDDNKIQIQYETLKEKKSCDICFHAAEHLYNSGVSTSKQNIFGSKLLSIKELLRGDFHLCPTASLFFRRKIVDQINSTWYKNAPVGDFFIRALAAKDGGIYYIDRFMSAYRVQAPGSWTATTMNSEKQNKFLKDFINSIIDFDKALNYQLHSELSYVICSLLKMFVLSPYGKMKNKRIFIDSIVSQLSFSLKIKWKVFYGNQALLSLRGFLKQLLNKR